MKTVASTHSFFVGQDRNTQIRTPDSLRPRELSLKKQPRQLEQVGVGHSFGTVEKQRREPGVRTFACLGSSGPRIGPEIQRGNRIDCYTSMVSQPVALIREIARAVGGRVQTNNLFRCERLATQSCSPAIMGTDSFSQRVFPA